MKLRGNAGDARVSELKIAIHRNRSHLSRFVESKRRNTRRSSRSISDRDDRENSYFAKMYSFLFCPCYFYGVSTGRRGRGRTEKRNDLAMEWRNTRGDTITRRVISSTDARSVGWKGREKKKSPRSIIGDYAIQSASLKNEFALSRAPRRTEKRRGWS